METIKPGIIVSIQGYSEHTTQEMAERAISAGASALRLDKKINSSIPMIGLNKVKEENKKEKAFITPDIPQIRSVMQWTNIIAIDYRRVNTNLRDVSKFCYDNGITVIADIETLTDYFNVMEKNYYHDYIATTLSVFHMIYAPDLSLVRDLSRNGCKNLIAEGNYYFRKDVEWALSHGAQNVCIGGGISDIYKLTRRYTTIDVERLVNKP